MNAGRTTGCRAGARLVIAAAVVCALGLSAAAEDKPWPAAVQGHKPVRPGEHPRLIFRKDDVPELRRRAATPEGKAILARCTKMLAARFTTWNAAGHAFCYQATGDKAHAERARQAAEQMMAGAANPDSRYNYLHPNGQLRAGPALGAMGLAYDMACDGWDEAFRKKVAEHIFNHSYTREIVESPRHGPGCNHYGAHQGGVGIALLALKGDGHVDDKTLDRWLASVVANVKRELTIGHGPKGYYYEGHHCGRLSSNTGVIPFLQCYRNAAGKDLVANCTHAEWLVTQWVYEFVRLGGQCRNLQRGMYASDPLPRGSSLSADGDFAQGFGICPAEHVPTVLWVYNRCVEPEGAAKTYDVLEYPHLAAWALWNWPWGVKEKNPGEIFPRVHHDPGPGYFVFRNGWTDGGDDIIVTALLGSTPRGGRGMAHGGSVLVLGLEAIRATFPGMFTASRMTYFKPEKDGSGVLSAVPIDGSTWKILADDPPKRLEPAVAAGPKLDAVASLAGLNGPDEDLAGFTLEEKKAPAKPKQAKPKAPAPTYGEVTSLAVDYSGRCGSACLIAMVGPQAGYGVAYWMEVVSGRIQDVQADNGANTKTTVLRAGPHVYYLMTVQKGDPPVVKAKGDKVVVGGRTVWFDGKKIVLGDAPAP